MSQIAKCPAQPDTLRVNKFSDLPHSTTPTPKNQPLRDLLAQAARRFETDPARAGEHFLIWLSLYCALQGVPWRRRVRGC